MTEKPGYVIEPPGESPSIAINIPKPKNILATDDDDGGIAILHGHIAESVFF